MTDPTTPTIQNLVFDPDTKELTVTCHYDLSASPQAIMLFDAPTNIRAVCGAGQYFDLEHAGADRRNHRSAKIGNGPAKTIQIETACPHKVSFTRDKDGDVNPNKLGTLDIQTIDPGEVEEGQGK